MYDTIRLESPSLSEDVAVFIEKKLYKLEKIDMLTGQVMFNITSKSLEGSWDNRIHVSVKREKYRRINSKYNPYKVPELLDCEPFLVVEGSIHKAMAGHNCYGGPDKIQFCCKWFVEFISAILLCELPRYDFWKLVRIDIAYVYDMDNQVKVTNFFRSMKMIKYPRRKTCIFGNETLYFSGSTTTLKLYNKHNEYKKHDMKRVKKFDKKLNDKIIKKCKGYLRVEVEIKKRKMETMFNTLFIKDIKDEDLIMIFDKEIERIALYYNETKVIRNHDSVFSRLEKLYGKRMSKTLMSTWYMLSVMGEEVTKARMSKTTYYKHRKLMKDASVSWRNTDVILKDENYIDEDFTLRRNSRFIVKEYDEKVLNAMRSA